MLVGAGTVLTRAQIDAAQDAGAQFVVSPGLNPKNVAYCQEKNLYHIPRLRHAGRDRVRAFLRTRSAEVFPPPRRLAGLRPSKRSARRLAW